MSQIEGKDYILLKTVSEDSKRDSSMHERTEVEVCIECKCINVNVFQGLPKQNYHQLSSLNKISLLSHSFGDSPNSRCWQGHAPCLLVAASNPWRSLATAASFLSLSVTWP